MKFSCKKEQLVHAVQIVQKAVSSKPQMPILSGIYLNALDNTLELQATDYELGISCKIDAQISEPGAIVLSGRYFQEVVRRLPGDMVEIVTNREDHTIKITSNTAQFNLLSLPASEFPVLHPLEGTTTFKIRDNVLRELIKKTVFACSQDEARPVFTGGLLEVSNSDVLMVATNTHRLSVKKEYLDSFSGAIKIIIPSKILNELARIMVSEVPSDVTIHCTRNQISFMIDNVYIISRLIEGQFPDYKRVIPENFSTEILLNTDDFLSAVERVSLISRAGDYNVIRLSFSQDSVVITSNNPDIGKAEESVNVSLSGNELDIAFNAKYVTDILKNIDSEKIYFSLNTPLSPASIRPLDDDTYNYIITPVRTS
ncbi:DNA polymerase III subunit beta [Anaerosinus massiliensis]|uniref:DNA polymerase III subunit beta n=1 Tax=Massilibacillus massiliensis TaxID=1806837 RepID=UPI000AEFF737|nr:DNA polymerase III subunit beta [Massilibacillus massiliensis]